MEKIDLLVLYPCEKTVLNSMDKISSYNEMRSFFLHESIEKIKSKKTHVVHACLSEFWHKKSKEKFDKLTTELAHQEIDVATVNNMIFCTIGGYKSFRGDSKQKLIDTVKGKTLKLDDYEVRLAGHNRLCTVGHFQKGYCDPEEFLLGGLTVASHVFVPKQNFSDRILRIHVDHNFQDRETVFEKIKEILYEIESKIKNHCFWKDLEIYYHSQKESIERLGHFNFTNIPLSSLANLYGSCHVGFMSHRETLGQYPLELLSCGANVIGDPVNHLPKEVSQQFAITDINNFSIDEVIDPEYIERNIMINREKVLKFDFDNYSRKIFNFIGLPTSEK